MRAAAFSSGAVLLDTRASGHTGECIANAPVGLNQFLWKVAIDLTP
jgi:hypothetical protein